MMNLRRLPYPPRLQPQQMRPPQAHQLQNVQLQRQLATGYAQPWRPSFLRGDIGDAPQPQAMTQRPQLEASPVRFTDYPGFSEVPAYYTISITLGGVAGNTQPGSVPLRPENFVCKRITWATTGDTEFEGGYSIQGRCVTVQWFDEFTRFFGDQPALISAVFGDSNGFLDLARGIMLQGKQTLSMQLTRVLWPTGPAPANTRIDFCFQGSSLLPWNIHQSGSAG
jgi:hypothetical protein